jgi:hypothetical protein
VLAQPELFVQHTPQRFDEDGRVIDTETRELLGDWLTAFREWVERLTREFGKRDRAAPRG